MAISQGEGGGAGGAALSAISAAIAEDEAKPAATTSENASFCITSPSSPRQASAKIKSIFLWIYRSAKIKHMANDVFLS
jgi:hypothetical protein